MNPLYEYMSVVLSKTDHVEEINMYAAIGWRLITVLKEQKRGATRPTFYAYFERVKQN